MAQASQTIQMQQQVEVKNPRYFKRIEAWKAWATPRRIFYIVILVLLLISMILFIIAVSITSSAQGTLPPTPVAFSATAQYISSPAQIRQGSIMFSSDYSTLMEFTDDLYLIDFNNKKVLWQANANQAGSLTVINPITGSPSYGNLQFLSTGTLYIQDGAGVIRWTNNVENKNVSVSNPFVLVATVNQQLQIQYLNDYLASNVSNYIWNASATSSRLSIWSKTCSSSSYSLLGPFKYLANSFVLQSLNHLYRVQLNEKGFLQIISIFHSNSMEAEVEAEAEAESKNNLSDELIWQSTFNPAVTPTENNLYSLVLNGTGTLSVVNQCDQTIWSSQTTFPTFFTNGMELQIDNSGSLILVADETIIWSSNNPSFSFSNPPLSCYSPLEQTPNFNIVSADQKSKVQLFNGDLYLLTTTTTTTTKAKTKTPSSSNSNTINISNTGGKASRAQIMRNGTFQLLNTEGQIVYEIQTEISKTCNFSATYLVYNNQFIAYQNSNMRPSCVQKALLFVRPYQVPPHVPFSITGGSNEALPMYPSKQIGSLFFLLSFVYPLNTNHNFVPSLDLLKGNFVLSLDLLKGTLNVLNVESGNVIGISNHFSPVSEQNLSNLFVFFKPNGLFLVQSRDPNNTNKNISLWNSGTAQPSEILNPTSSLFTKLDEMGNWFLFVNSQINVLLNKISNRREMWSITSVTTIYRSQEINDFHHPSQNYYSENWKLLSTSGLYYLTFTTEGYLAVYRNQQNILLWKSDQPANAILFDALGNLNLVTDNNIIIPFLVSPQNSNSENFPYSLCLSDTPEILIITTEGTTVSRLAL